MVLGKDLKLKKISEHLIFILLFRFVVLEELSTVRSLSRVSKCGSEGGVLFSNKQQQL